MGFLTLVVLDLTAAAAVVYAWYAYWQAKATTELAQQAAVDMEVRALPCVVPQWRPEDYLRGYWASLQPYSANRGPWNEQQNVAIRFENLGQPALDVRAHTCIHLPPEVCKHLRETPDGKDNSCRSLWDTAQGQCGGNWDVDDTEWGTKGARWYTVSVEAPVGSKDPRDWIFALPAVFKDLIFPKVNDKGDRGLAKGVCIRLMVTYADIRGNRRGISGRIAGNVRAGCGAFWVDYNLSDWRHFTLPKRTDVERLLRERPWRGPWLLLDELCKAAANAGSWKDPTRQFSFERDAPTSPVLPDEPGDFRGLKDCVVNEVVCKVKGHV
jgi:hypothetical protein